MFQKEDVKDAYSLSPMQEAMLFDFLTHQNTDAYFEQFDVQMNNELDLDLFTVSLNKLIEKHDILRTVFLFEKLKKPRQVVLKKRQSTVRYEDISDLDDKEQIRVVKKFKYSDKKRGFNLKKDILMRISIFKLSIRRYRIIWSFHHIIMDGWGINHIVKDLLQIYTLLRHGRTVNIAPAPSYSQYIKWLEKQNKNEGLEYWKNYLEGYEHQATFQRYGRQLGKNKYKLAQYGLQIDENITRGLKNTAVANRVTLNTILLAVWGLLLRRYTNKSDVVFGIVPTVRPSEIEGIEKMIGLFVNNIPFRVNFAEIDTFSQLVRKLQDEAAMSKPYEYLPLVEIQSASIPEGNLIDHIIIFENYPLKEGLQSLLGKSKFDFLVENVEIFEQTNYDFYVRIVPWESLTLDFFYNSFVFENGWIEKVALHFKKVSQLAASHSDFKLEEIEIVSEEEKRTILNDFNNTVTEYPRNLLIHEVFDEQVEVTPDKIALVYESLHNIDRRQLSYRDLQKRSNGLARSLVLKGVQRDGIVGLMTDRSLEMIVAILAILRAGGGYLSINLDYPDERKRYMMTESGMKILLTNADMENDYGIDTLDVRNIEIDNAPGTQPTDHSRGHRCINGISSLAYVIYTSGSTGKPKGVMVDHHSVVRLVKNSNYVCFGEQDRLLQTGVLEFDVSTFEIWGPLLNGLSLYIMDLEKILTPETLTRTIRSCDISILWMTSPLFNQMVEMDVEIFKGIDQLLVGGDVLSPVHIGKVKRRFPALKVINGYGPTENTSFSTTFLVDKEYSDSIPIGHPIANSTAYVVDHFGKLQPIGFCGELYVGGDGVARGYLNRPELTAERFESDLFIAGERIYRTGDLVRYADNGTIEFFGRIDNQVKIRGFRVELEEIDLLLVAHQLVQEAVTTVRASGTDRSLCAYFVAVERGMIDISDLRDYLSGRVPDYMMPSNFVELDRLPLTPNGKIDRLALPEPEMGLTAENFAAPENEIEERLVEIWAEVLGVDKDNISVNENFFRKGGDSIKAIQVASRLKKYNMKIELGELISNPTIRNLSQKIKIIERKNDYEIVEGEVQLTPIQHWFFENKFSDRHHFNQSLILFKPDGFDEDIVYRVFLKIVEHHDALRMVFLERDKKTIQVNRGLDDRLIDFEVMNLKGEGSLEKEIEEESRRIQGSIDLETGPLVKLGLMKTFSGDHLLIVIHHLVVDGVSWRIILEDFGLGYRSAEKGEEITFQTKTDSFRHWARKLSEYAMNETLLQERSYWDAVSGREIMSLPRDFDVAPKENKYKNVDVLTLSLGSADTGRLLTQVNNVYNTEINDILLAALGMAVREWTGIDEVVINLEGHGRELSLENVDISRTVGWFTSQYPLLLDMRRTDDLSYLLKSVKETLRQVPQKGSGYGILKYLTPAVESGLTEFTANTDISFNYLGQFAQEVESGSEKNVDKGRDPGNVIRISGMNLRDTVSPEIERQYSLDINGMLVRGSLNLLFSYNKCEYRKESIERLVENYRACLTEIINHCCGKQEVELTPSDLARDEELSIEEFEDLKEFVNLNVEN